jgi:hypothetical protein
MRFKIAIQISSNAVTNTCITRLTHEILARELPRLKQMKNGSRKCTCVEIETPPDGATDLVLPSLYHFSYLSLKKRPPSSADLELEQGIEILMFYVVSVFGRS